MPINRRNRATGYIKGIQSREDLLQPLPEEHLISKETGRPTIPTTSVDIGAIKKWKKELSPPPIYMSDAVPQGQAIFVDHGALPYHHGVYLHPTDYYWVKHKDNPELAHNLVMSWIEQRIESMGRDAEARLDAMVEEMEYKASFTETMVRYKENLKFYTDLMGQISTDYSDSWESAVEAGERIHQACDEEVHRDHDQMDSILHGFISYQDVIHKPQVDRYAGRIDDWFVYPKVIDPKRGFIFFDHKNGA